jgi:carbonic anhydrase/acetyltransferase-like protein (isoleucine patch superfamily)
MAGDEEVSRLVRAVRDVDLRLRADMRRDFDRDLPLAELLFDRWERARALGFGEGASISPAAYVYGDVRVGEHSWIGPMVILDGSHAPIEVGHHCSISAGVHVYTHDTVAWALSGGAQPAAGGPVSIGDCTHVGAQTVISHGSAIGDHCVIGAHLFANADIAPFSVAYGAPARVRGRVVVDDDGVPRLEHD